MDWLWLDDGSYYICGEIIFCSYKAFVDKIKEGRLKKNETDSVTPYLPKNGWLGTYLRFTQNLEACPRFRFFCACCVMGAAINNRVWIQRGDEGLLPRLMPNPWVILLAPPYRGHKTACINMSSNCLIQAYEDIRILADKLTPEAIVHALSAPQNPKEVIRIGPRDATGLIQAPEMSVIFGKQQYNVGMVSLITDLYDYREEWKSETIGRGKEILRNNCISILAGSTPRWLQSMIPQDAFSGGFMRRFIIVELPGNFYKRDASPKKPKDMEWKKVIELFKQFRAVKGQMGWTKEGKKFYDEDYENFEPSGDEQYDSYREAMSEQMLKIAMLLDINKGHFDLTEDSVRQAKNILMSIMPETLLRIEALTTHPRMHVTQEIKELITLHGELGEAELLSKVYRSLSQGERQFYEALSILKSTHIIEPIGKPGNYRYRLRKGEANDSVEPSSKEPKRGNGISSSSV